jgi:outer membrane usher protein
MLACLLLAASAREVQAFQQIRAVMVARATGYTRVTFESDSPFRYTLAPRGRTRVLIELADMADGGVLQALPAEIGQDDPYIATAEVRRTGEHAAILELTFRVPAQARAVAVPGGSSQPHRLVLDIWPAPAELPREAEAAPAFPEADELLLSIRLNSQAIDRPAIVWRDLQGQLFMRADDLAGWRLDVPADAVLVHRGEKVVPLATLPGLTAQIDTAAQSLELIAPAAQFAPTTLAVAPVVTRPMPAAPGAFANYDVEVVSEDRIERLGANLELGSYGPWGVVTTQGLHRDDGSERSTIRLDSLWTHDVPERLTSWRVGDAISRAGSWSGAVRFGGVQFARNFATQPGFSTLPEPGLAGEAVLPSTVELFINDALRLRERVTPGPFSIPALPTVSGRGEVRMVVRDVLGRETVTTQSFYTSPRLLRAGLQDFSYELGAIRENYGLASNDYGRLLGIATHRLGLSDRLTGEVHAELLARQQTLGVGLVRGLPFGVVSGAVSASHGDVGEGGLLTLGFERQGRYVGLGVETQRATPFYTHLGWGSDADPLRARTRAYASVSAGRFGSFGMAYTGQEYSAAREVALLSASYGLSLGRQGFLSVSAIHAMAPAPHTQFGLTFTHALGPRTSYSIATTADSDRQDSHLQLQRSLPAGTGVGYRLRTSVGSTEQDSAEITAQNAVGRYALEMARRDDREATRARVSGAVVAVRDGLFATRRVDDGFAVVHVPGQAGVRVYADNQPVARTDSRGMAFVPYLRSYQANRLRLEVADLPLDAEIGRIEFDAVPAFRSGLTLEFPVRLTVGATLTVLRPGGGPMPAGAVARLEGSDDRFPVAEGGALYLTGLQPNNRLIVAWKDRECWLGITLPRNGTDPLPDLGAHLCEDLVP